MSTNVGKTMLINNVHESVADQGLSKAKVEAVFNAIVNEICSVVAQGDKVQIIGFGTFESRKREERQGRNPQTGESITIPERTVPVFRPGATFKEIVRG